MASKEFDKYLNSLSAEEKAKLGNIGKDLKEQGVSEKTEEKADIQKAQELGKDVSKGTNVNASNMEADKDATYKANTGRPELDKNVGGYDKTETPAQPITEKVGKEAKEAAEPIKNEDKPKDSEKENPNPDKPKEGEKDESGKKPDPNTTPQTIPTQQRNNAFTQLGEAKPKEQLQENKDKNKDKDRDLDR
jgi:hypothetical protein